MITKWKERFIHSYLLLIRVCYPLLVSFALEPWRCRRDGTLSTWKWLTCRRWRIVLSSNGTSTTVFWYHMVVSISRAPSRVARIRHTRSRNNPMVAPTKQTSHQRPTIHVLTNQFMIDNVGRDLEEYTTIIARGTIGGLLSWMPKKRSFSFPLLWDLGPSGNLECLPSSCLVASFSSSLSNLIEKSLPISTSRFQVEIK